MLGRLKKIASQVSMRARRRRAKLFRSNFKIDASTTIVDLGSQDGAHISLVLDGTGFEPSNVWVADLYSDAMDATKAKYGFQAAVLKENEKLPFEDKSFEIVFCSSVIEHVTLSKEEVWKVIDGDEFRSRSWQNQKAFADEIRRIGKGYFVQTPNRNFPIESHTWLPFAGILPRRMLISVIRFANRFWLFYSMPDFNLLDREQMATLFPDAKIVCERKFGLVKSIMAIKTGA